jgi:hypothetical protein
MQVILQRRRRDRHCDAVLALLVSDRNRKGHGRSATPPLVAETFSRGFGSTITATTNPPGRTVGRMPRRPRESTRPHEPAFPGTTVRGGNPPAGTAIFRKD